VEKKALQEIYGVLGDVDDPDYEVATTRLPYLYAIILEGLRLFPPAPATSRHLTKSVDVAGHSIPAGTMIYIPIWWVHRSIENWGPDAAEFKPGQL
jgi:cytochrome P450